MVVDVRELEVVAPEHVPSIEERVRAGALMLDEFRPGWYMDVRLDLLDMGSGTSCVLGQLFGGFYKGNEEVYGPIDSRDMNETLGAWHRRACAGATRHGFLAQVGHSIYGTPAASVFVEYYLLTEAWSREITRRRNLRQGV